MIRLPNNLLLHTRTELSRDTHPFADPSVEITNIILVRRLPSRLGVYECLECLSFLPRLVRRVEDV